MIPVPPATKAKILAWLPHLLAGYDYPVIETDNIVRSWPHPQSPSIFRLQAHLPSFPINL